MSQYNIYINKLLKNSLYWKSDTSLLWKAIRKIMRYKEEIKTAVMLDSTNNNCKQ